MVIKTRIKELFQEVILKYVRPNVIGDRIIPSMIKAPNRCQKPPYVTLDLSG
jgi:hypothetical protein